VSEHQEWSVLARKASGTRGKAKFYTQDGRTVYAEELAAETLRAKGYQTRWTENQFWWTVMALLFWDEIFEDDPAVFNPNQDMPSDLFDKGFYVRRREAVRRRTAYLLTKELPAELEAAYRRYFGKRFRMLPLKMAETGQGAVQDWGQVVLADLTEVCRHLEPRQVVGIVDRILRDINGHRMGLPDLSAWDTEGFRFFEVKGPGDRERPEQQGWFAYLSGELGIPCDIFRVIAARTKRGAKGREEETPRGAGLEGEAPPSTAGALQPRSVPRGIRTKSRERVHSTDGNEGGISPARERVGLGVSFSIPAEGLPEIFAESVAANEPFEVRHARFKEALGWGALVARAPRDVPYPPVVTDLAKAIEEGFFRGDPEDRIREQCVGIIHRHAADGTLTATECEDWKRAAFGQAEYLCGYVRPGQVWENEARRLYEVDLLRIHGRRAPAKTPEADRIITERREERYWDICRRLVASRAGVEEKRHLEMYRMARSLEKTDPRRSLELYAEFVTVANLARVPSYVLGAFERMALLHERAKEFTRAFDAIRRYEETAEKGPEVGFSATKGEMQTVQRRKARVLTKLARQNPTTR
jgi:hypothetical protein